MKHLATQTLLIILLLSLCSCGYSFKSGRTKPGLEKVAVPYFENKSSEPSADIDLTEAIIEGLISDRTLQVVEEDEADVLVLGKILSYQFREAFFGNDRQAEEYRVEIAVEVSLYHTLDKKTIAGPKRIKGSGSYYLEEGSEGEDAARVEAAENIVAGILNLVVEEW